MALRHRGLHVAVVGAGPAGLYAADRLLSRTATSSGDVDVALKVDVLERLPVPYGLVRFGVAPDHPEVKNASHKFDTVLAHPNVRFFGNVHVQSVKALREHYDAVILANGAEEDRELGVPGEREAAQNGAGMLSAREFVGWYNGHPDLRHLRPRLDSTDRAVVVGQGNVALDVARVLLSPVDALAKTDIAPHALEELRKSRIRRVDIVGRRGPVQVAFTIKELREMMNLPANGGGTLPLVSDSQAQTTEALDLLLHSKPKWEKERPRKRLMELLQTALRTASADQMAPSSKAWSLHFLRSPAEIVLDASRKQVTALKLVVNSLDSATENAVPTGLVTSIPTGLVLRSIGYKSVPFVDAPFDNRTKSIPNSAGRVVDSSTKEPVSGLYVAGWIKRGPVGVIASTLSDAHETADSLLADLTATGSSSKAGFEGFAKSLPSSQQTFVTKEGLGRIDALERTRGRVLGIERVKICDWAELLAVGGQRI